MTDANSRQQELGPRGWTLFSATVFGLVGLVVGALILWFGFTANRITLGSLRWTVLLPYVVSAWISGAVVGGLAWWILVEKPKNASSRRGLVTGAVAMLATHLLMFVIPTALEVATGWSLPTLPRISEDPAAVVGYTLAPMFLAFPFSVPAAALVGRALARRRRRQIGEKRTTDVRERLDRLSPRGWTLFAASVFGLGAMLTAVLVPLLFGMTGFAILFAPGAGVGGFVVGGTLWGVIVETRGSVSDRTGALLGAMTALLIHFVVALFEAVGVYGPTLSSFPPSVDLVSRVISSGMLTLVIGGMVTIPVGAYIGWRLAVFRQPTIAGSDTTAVDDVTTE